MAQMALAIPMLAGTALSAFGAMRQGQAENEAAKYRARQLEHQATQEQAAGQHAAEEKRRQSMILQSRALAAAGASGAGTLDSNVLNMISGIAGEGELAAQTEMHGATDRANRARQGAAMSRTEGKIAKKAGTMRAVGTAFEGMADTGTSMGFGR